MKKIRFLGPMEKRTYQRGREVTTHEMGGVYEEDDGFADECLAMNPDNLTVEQAAAYGIPVYELVRRTARHEAEPES